MSQVSPFDGTYEYSDRNGQHYFAPNLATRRQMLFMVTSMVENRVFHRQMCFFPPNHVYLAHIAKYGGLFQFFAMVTVI